MIVASDPGAVALVVTSVWLGASPEPEVEALRSTVALPVPVETFDRSGAAPADPDPTVTVVDGTLAVAVVPVVVTVVVGAATVVVVPSVASEPEDVDAVTVVGLTSTVPVLETVADVVVPLIVSEVPVVDVLAVAVVLPLPFGSFTVMVVSSGGGSARAVRGPAIEIAAAMTATARVRIAAFMFSSPVHGSRCARGTRPGAPPARTRAGSRDR
jgi:hypothetical protein